MWGDSAERNSTVSSRIPSIPNVWNGLTVWALKYSRKLVAIEFDAVKAYSKTFWHELESLSRELAKEGKQQTSSFDYAW